MRLRGKVDLRKLYLNNFRSWEKTAITRSVAEHSASSWSSSFAWACTSGSTGADNDQKAIIVTATAGEYKPMSFSIYC